MGLKSGGGCGGGEGSSTSGSCSSSSSSGGGTVEAAMKADGGEKQRRRRYKQQTLMEFQGQEQEQEHQLNSACGPRQYQRDSSCAPLVEQRREFPFQSKHRGQQERELEQHWSKQRHDIQAERCFEYPASITATCTAAAANIANVCQPWQKKEQQYHHNGVGGSGSDTNSRGSTSALYYNANLVQETKADDAKQARQTLVAEVRGQQQQQPEAGNRNEDGTRRTPAAEAQSSSLVLVSKESLSELTEQIAFSMNKMKDLEEQVKVIPELQRRLEDVIQSDSSSVKDYNQHQHHHHHHNPNQFHHYGHARSPVSSTTRADRQFASSMRVEEKATALLLREYNACTNRSNSNYNFRQKQDNFSNQSNQAMNGSGGEDFLHAREIYPTSPSPSTPFHRRHYNSLTTRKSRYSPTSSSPVCSFAALSSSSANNSAVAAGSSNHQASMSTAIDVSFDQQHAGSSPGSMGATHNAFISAANANISTSSSNRDHHQRAQHLTLDKSPHNHHRHYSNSISGSRQSFNDSSLANVLRRSNHQDSISNNNNNSSTLSCSGTQPKVEYEDLINDLISLSYSVNYMSPTHNNHSHHQSQSALASASSNQHSVPFNSTTRQVRQQQQRDLVGSMHIAGNFNSNNIHNHHQYNSMRTSSLSYLAKNYGSNSGRGGSLSYQGTPVKTTPLDCGCQSFKEHLRYNTISREQRMQQQQQHNQVMKSQSVLTSNSATTAAVATSNRGNTVSPQPIVQAQTASNKCDASTNTDLIMEDIFTRHELENVVTKLQKNCSTLSSSNDDEGSETSRERKSANYSDENSFNKNINNQSLSSSPSTSESGTSSGSLSGPKSTSPPNDDDDDSQSSHSSEQDVAGESNSSDKITACATDKLRNTNHNRDDDDLKIDHDDDDDEEEEEATNAESLICKEPYSLGSSYQDPSDFEEYCAYEESLDRRTKDFMSQSTKIPNDLRFALIRLSEFLKRNQFDENLESSSGCIEVIRKEWFKIAADKDSQPGKVRLYVEYFESFTKQLLNTVVNLIDSAGNTAMHYAASHYKLDIIKVLLETKVCDVNCRNRAGYTAIMLLALAEIECPEEKEIASQLFSIGDVNIKAKSSGQTALMLAASHGRVSTCKLLLECGANPSLQDYDGSTALMCGSEIGSEEVVKCLLAHKLTDPTATDNDGLDAVTIAMNNGHKNVGLILYAAKNSIPRMICRRSSAGRKAINT